MRARLEAAAAALTSPAVTAELDLLHRGAGDVDAGSACTAAVVPVTVFLSEFRPPMYATWAEMLVTLARCEPELRVVTALTVELAAAGAFETPVTVDAETRTLMNGCHRVAATIAAGHPTIGFKHTGDISSCDTYVEVTLTLAAGVDLHAPWPATTVGADGDVTDVFDAVFSNLRSFRTRTGVWLEFDSMAAQNGRVSLSGAWQHDDAATLAAELDARAVEVQLPVAVCCVDAVDDDFVPTGRLWSAAGCEHRP